MEGNLDKIHLILYADEKFKNAKNRIYSEALNTNWFFSIKCYGPEDLSISFKNEFKSILSLERGGGFWIWKFDIILNRLEEINYGDFLIYIDSGCTININGSERFRQYIQMIKNNEKKIISFQMDHIEKTFTTKEIFELFGIIENDPIELSGQYVATILIMQKCDAVINIFKDGINKIKIDNNIITDYYNKNQRPCFKDNRHDQSILSIIRKLHGSIVIQDETYNIDFNSESIQKIPFLATRKR